MDIAPGIDRRADGPVIDAEVHPEDDLLIRRELAKLSGFHLKWKIQAVPVEGINERRTFHLSE